MLIFDETRRLHPLRECIGGEIVGTGNSTTNVSLTFSNGGLLSFDQKGNDVLVSYREREDV
jgi:hypothetical protein